MRINLIAVLTIVAASLLIAAIPNNAPVNSMIVWEDSTRVDSTETKRMVASWPDNGAQMTLLVELRDDSAAGFAADSACVSIKLYQLFTMTKNGLKYFARLNSKAHPDSTTSSFSGSSSFSFGDSINVRALDTACVYLRNYKAGGGVLNEADRWGDSLKTLQGNTAGFGGFAYYDFAPSYSPAIEFELTGKASNRKKGVGSIVKLRLYQLIGTKVKGQ